MKIRTHITITLAVLLLACATRAEAAGKFAFRNQPWGSTQNQVLDGEPKAPKDTSKEYMTYDANLFGYNFDAVYIFKNDSLFMGKYIFTTEYKEKDFNKYILAYNKLKDQLAEKYGRPDADKLDWIDSRLEFDKGQWGLAIALGHVLRYATWTKDDTEINIHLNGMNGNIHLQIQYRNTRVGTRSEDML